jgi:hypothetical protein
MQTMNTIVSRAALTAFLAMSLGGGLVTVIPAAASAQVSPADPSYSYDTRGKTVPWGVHGAANSAFAQAATPHAQYRTGLSARASTLGDGVARAQDPDRNVRLQMLRSEGIFDR